MATMDSMFWKVVYYEDPSPAPCLGYVRIQEMMRNLRSWLWTCWAVPKNFA